MVHPAPRITTAPTPKSPNMENNCAGGICACAAARVILHATNVSVCCGGVGGERPQGQ